MKGRAYEGNYGSIDFDVTVVDDRGRGAAEYKYGADFALTADITQGNKHVKKAILGQSKKGEVESLSRSKLEKLIEQIEKMHKKTSAPKVLEVPMIKGEIPRICSGKLVLAGETYTRIEFGDYIVRFILTCIEGDTRPEFVTAVKESSLSQLEVVARDRIYVSRD